jgi:hypothetical protein
MLRAAKFMGRTLVPISLLSLLAISGCEKRKKEAKHPGAEVTHNNHPTINLFGFEESQLHHIHNTVELHRNIFLVHYDPMQPGKLEWVNCPISANYTYRKSAGRRVESMYIRSFADLQARVPVNFARFEAYVKGGKALEFNYVTIGSYELLSDFQIPKDDPDCARATHYVTTLSVGAFNFAEERSVEGGISANVAGTGAGGGVAGGRGSGESTSMGDLSACMDDGTAALDCFTPLQVLMIPLASRHWEGNGPAVADAHTSSASNPGDTSPTTANTDLSLVIHEDAWRPGSFMAAALERLLIVASRVNMTTDFGFDDQGSTVVAGFLRQGKPQTLRRTLEAGKNYAIVGAGSTEANIDIAIYDSQGRMVAQDAELDSNPTLVFKPPTTDNYAVELSVVNQAEEFGALVVMTEGGLRIEAPILQSVFQRLLNAGEFASGKVQELGFQNGLIFHENDWAVQGTVLYPGEAIRQRGISLAANSAVFAAVAHADEYNIDLEVIDTVAGNSWSDTEPDSNPVVIVDQPDPNSSYDFRVMYGEGEGATLATSLILKLSD